MRYLNKNLIFCLLILSILTSCKSTYMVVHDVKIPPYPLDGQTTPDWDEFTKITSELYFKDNKNIHYHNDVIVYRATKKQNRNFKYFLNKYWEGVLNSDLEDSFKYIKLK